MEAATRRKGLEITVKFENGEVVSVGQAADREVFTQVWREKPGGLVLLRADLALQETGSLVVWLRAAEPPPAVLVFGPHDDRKLEENLEDLGASGYLPAWRVVNELLETVERVTTRPARKETP